MINIQGVVDFIAAFSRPLDLSIVVAAVISGLILGKFYNQRLNLPPSYAFHKWVAATAFLFMVFLVRLIAVGTFQPAGYLGIAVLWGIFCFCAFLGQKIYIRKGADVLVGKVRKR